MSAQDAPPGYLTLGEAAQRLSDGRQVTIERGRGIVARAVQSGQVEAIRWSGGNLVLIAGVDLLADLDFTKSEMRIPGMSYLLLHAMDEEITLSSETIWPSCYVSERDIERLIEQGRARPPAPPGPEAAPPPAPVTIRPAGRRCTIGPQCGARRFAASFSSGCLKKLRFWLPRSALFSRGFSSIPRNSAQ
ncbi:MAG: hypothetical protein ACREE4_22105 [Stellaceae bacterium]